MYNVKGKSIKDISQLSYEELSQMDRRTLAKVTSRLNSAANKRIRALEKEGFDPNIRSYSFGKRFSVKGLDKKDLLSTFRDVKEFLSRKTTTIRGYRKWQKFAEEYIEDLDEGLDDEFWDIYKELYHESTLTEKVKYDVFDVIRTEFDNGRTNKEKIKAKVKNMLKKMNNNRDIDFDKYLKS